MDRVTRLLPRSGPLASPAVQRIALGLLLLAVIALPLVVQTPPLDLVEGKPSPRTVRAPRAVQFVDQEATRALREMGKEGEDVVILKQAGENIVLEGEIVTAQDIEVIRRLGLLEQSGSALSFAS
ncbi:hypothetical protein EG835_08290, partial [bacterium]|nr:hypothetical protein [bacterium]